MLQLIYELRKNWRGRVDGTGRDGRIEGTTRGPRGPKKTHFVQIFSEARSTFVLINTLFASLPTDPEASCTLEDYPRWMYQGPTANFVAGHLVACQRSACYFFEGMTWTKLVDTRSPRMLHSSAESEDRILLIGGSASNSTEWIPVDGSPSQPGPFEVRHGHAHCTEQVSSDLMVVIGGIDTWDYVTEYQLTGEATETALSSLIIGREEHACGVYQEGGGQQVRLTLVLLCFSW